MLWRFRTVMSCTSTAAANGTVGAGVTGFAGAAVYIAVFPLALRRARSPKVPPPWCLPYRSADLKELPSADLHGLLLVSTLYRSFTFLYLKRSRWLLFFFADGPQGSKWINFHIREEL